MPNRSLLKDLVYWRDWQKSLAVFAPGFVLLLCLTLFPFLTVLAYTGLFVIAVNFTLRLYVAVLGYLNKNKTVAADAEPSKSQCRYEKAVETYLSGADVQLNEARVMQQVETGVARWNTWLPWLQRLVLAEDVFATLKLALALWLLTYVGAWVSPAAMTLISFVATFTLPKFYQTYKKPIDKRLADVSKKAQSVSSAVKDKYSSLTTQKQQLKKTE